MKLWLYEARVNQFKLFFLRTRSKQLQLLFYEVKTIVVVVAFTTTTHEQDEENEEDVREEVDHADKGDQKSQQLG